MNFRAFRFRRFSLRLLAWLLALLLAALAATYTLVSRANTANAHAHAAANLELAARVYDAAIRQRIEYLVGSASVMTGDDAIKQVLRDGDVKTLGSALESYTQRVGAPVIGLFDPEGRPLANSEPGMDNDNAEPFAALIARATKGDMPQASDFSYLKNQLHVLVVVPLYAPFPIITDWFGLAFPIDRAFAQKIKDTTRIEVTFVETEGSAQPRVLASTLSDPAAQIVARAAAAHRTVEEPVQTLDLPDDRYVSLFKTQDLLGTASIAVVLQRPLGPELAAAHALEASILRISVAALCFATLVALWIARGVSQPVQQLAAHTQLIARGDYDSRLNLNRADELGQLADAMNSMSAGLAERDQVRDLLDKNVSPEVAAQLMRDGGAALGGEEREVTILFADLRGFTTLSENRTPQEVIALLNRYLTRMSGAIELSGGVIDKFIGDEIMALFGAPVSMGNDANGALAAALAMETELKRLNAELAIERHPPLAFGIGINTARVVAGNIGSERRLNYSVIGDGVNVAARLQSLTRQPGYCANIIASAATMNAAQGRMTQSIIFRPLGSVEVKGRAEPVEIFAVEARDAL